MTTTTNQLTPDQVRARAEAISRLEAAKMGEGESSEFMAMCDVAIDHMVRELMAAGIIDEEGTVDIDNEIHSRDPKLYWDLAAIFEPRV